MNYACEVDSIELEIFPTLELSQKIGVFLKLTCQLWRQTGQLLDSIEQRMGRSSVVLFQPCFGFL